MFVYNFIHDFVVRPVVSLLRYVNPVDIRLVLMINVDAVNQTDYCSSFDSE